MYILWKFKGGNMCTHMPVRWRGVEREGERESQAGSEFPTQSPTGRSNLWTVRLWLEQKSRVRCLTDEASQAPQKINFFNEGIVQVTASADALEKELVQRSAYLRPEGQIWPIPVFVLFCFLSCLLGHVHTHSLTDGLGCFFSMKPELNKCNGDSMEHKP